MKPCNFVNYVGYPVLRIFKDDLVILSINSGGIMIFYLHTYSC